MSSSSVKSESRTQEAQIFHLLNFTTNQSRAIKGIPIIIESNGTSVLTVME